MRIYEPLASTQRKLEGTLLLAAENVFLNWTTIRGITLTHVIMKTQGTTGITETPLSKISENTHIFKGSEKESENVLRRTAGGALPSRGDLAPLRCRLHHLSALPETQNVGFTASPPSEVEVLVPCHHHISINLKRPCQNLLRRVIRAANQIV